LGDVAEILSGGTPSSSKPEYWTGGDIPWATLPDLRSKYLFDTQTQFLKKGNKKRRLTTKESELLKLL